MDDVIKIEKPPAVSAVRGFSNVVVSQQNKPPAMPV